MQGNGILIILIHYSHNLNFLPYIYSQIQNRNPYKPVQRKKVVTIKKPDGGGGGGRLQKQTTLADIYRVQVITSLTAKQKRIVTLLEAGLTQGLAAERLHVSRSLVSQTVRMLEKHNLIKKQHPSTYNSFYEISKELKAHIGDETAPRLTNCDTHHIRRKYRILNISLPLSMDKRAGYIRSWDMRGSTWHKFWYPGKAGEPRITINVMPHTIVVYPDARQKILAGSIKEAEDKMNMACHNAVQKFIRDQGRFGVHIEIDELGKQITPTHYAFPLSKSSPYAEAGSTAPDTWTDGSPQKHGEPDRVEYETTDPNKATSLDLAIDKVLAVDELVKGSIKDAMPEAMRELEDRIGPLTKEMHTVIAHIQSGLPFQNQVDQLIILFGKMLERQNEIEDKLKGVTAVEITRVISPAAYTPCYEE